MSNTQVPEKCRFVSGHLSRANEMKKADPIISYFCKLKAVQDVLATNLHREDPRVMQFVSGLLDEIEDLKRNDESLNSESGKAVLEDDTTAQAYVEQVAGKVLDKADDDIRGGRATKATSLGLLAAVTFMDLTNLFSVSLTPELQEKTKYAKYHAARIIKALKAGQDPNSSVSGQADKSDGQSVSGQADKFDGQSVSAQADKSDGQAKSSVSGHAPKPDEVVPSLVVPSTQPSKAVAGISTLNDRKGSSMIDIVKATNDAEAMTSAQKHAKLAISALNFEDIETGKKQLRCALEILEKLDI